MRFSRLFLSLSSTLPRQTSNALSKRQTDARSKREREREIDDEREFQQQHQHLMMMFLAMPVGKKRQNIFTQSGLDLDDVFFTLGRSCTHTHERERERQTERGEGSRESYGERSK